MIPTLTAEQTDELHNSIIVYLVSVNASRSAALLRQELGIDSNADDAGKKYHGLLEKKWASETRLQKRILELEIQLARIQPDLKPVNPVKSPLVNIRSIPIKLCESEAKPASPIPLRSNTTWLPGSHPKHTLQSHRGAVTCVSFHPFHHTLASASEDCTINIWDWKLGKLERTLKGHPKPVLGVDYGEPNRHTLLASCSSDLTIKLWDASNNYTIIRTLSGHEHLVSAVRFAPPGNLLVSASRDASLRIWDALTGACVKVISTSAWVRDVSLSEDGAWLVSAGHDHAAILWDLSSGDVQASLQGHGSCVECCAVAPQSSHVHLAALDPSRSPSSQSAAFIATGARDKTIRIWDDQGTVVKILEGHHSWVRGLVFHPGGKYLISVGDDRTIRCWDLSQEARLVKTIAGAPIHFVSCVGLLHQGTSRVLATGSSGSCVRIWM
ncbi:nuclear migration protein NudF [Penicillium alfredii]|uniref:Nuclear distribution protein nudF n=1 Tax=Penicillium alfredii TaxID=1506179 RepID=A0A9W9G970_9EURO|nr:nuclear migration protein NudF [Penicillium alfredii]KAJ5114297.1 nuclear migration protein NudF [Penicillium alfredii]